MAQKIQVSAGAQEYTFPTTITEDTFKDISSDTIRVSLGDDNEPGDWLGSDNPFVVLTYGPQAYQATVKILVGTQAYMPLAGLGRYRVWVFVTDSPEFVPRRGAVVTLT